MSLVYKKKNMIDDNKILDLIISAGNLNYLSISLHQE